MAVRSWRMVFAVGCLALGACQYSPDTAQRTISYNVGIAQSTNNMFLLNALRSAERQPTYYTRNQSNTTSSTLNPSITSTLPVGRSIASTWALQKSTGLPSLATPPGFPSVATTTLMATAAAATIAPALSATETNQLALTNLDDQQSMQGLMSPVSMQQAKNYITERFSREEVSLLYIDQISMKRAVWDSLYPAAKTHCAKIKVEDNIYCRYVDLGFRDRTAPPGAQPQQLLPACFDRPSASAAAAESDTDLEARFASLPPTSSKSHQADPSKDLVTFVNDPAIASLPGGADIRQVRSFACFHQVLRVLLALELDFADDPPDPQYRLDAALISANPRLLSDLTSQKLIFAHPFKDAEGKIYDVSQFGVCKAADGLHFALADDPDIKHRFAVAMNDKSVASGRSFQRSDDDGLDPTDCATQVRRWESGEKEPDPIIKITPRSLESMVYYLGEIVRHDYFPGPQVGDAPDERATVLTWSSPPAVSLYEQNFFVVVKASARSAPNSAMAFAADATGTYYVPALCSGGDHAVSPCVNEYPDHSSGQVLTIVNQLWGLNKTVATAPAIPTVTVVSH